MLDWNETLKRMGEQQPFPSIDALLGCLSQYRQPATYDALQGAMWRRGIGTPMDWVGDGTNDHWRDVDSEWDDEPTQPTISESGISNALPMRLNVQIPIPRMTLVPGDIHCPIWDKALVFAVLGFAAELGVDHLALVGDTLDVYGASRFSKEARELYNGHRSTLADELRHFTGFVYEADRIFERVDYLCGNHEGRAVERFVNENPWLYQHPAFDPHSLFQLPSHWNAYEPGTRLRMGRVCIEHGEKLKGSGSKYGAAAVLRNNPYQHTVFGHVHRYMRASHTVYDAQGQPRTYTAQSAGHLSQLRFHSEYACQPDWQQAFTIIEHSPCGEYPTIHTVLVQNGRWRWGGKEYGV